MYSLNLIIDTLGLSVKRKQSKKYTSENNPPWSSMFPISSTNDKT